MKLPMPLKSASLKALSGSQKHVLLQYVDFKGILAAPRKATPPRNKRLIRPY